jgi:hypothetical protein
MLWAAAACVVGAAVLVIRWSLDRYDALGRAKPFPKIAVPLLGVMAVALALPSYLRHQEEDRLSAVASSLVGTHAVVHCQTFGQEMVDPGAELGFVRYDADGTPEHQTLIKRGPCHALRAYLHSNKHAPSDDEVVAVHVLTHESMHMRGITSESEAECAAMQRDEDTARLLGADPAEARALARRYWLNFYPLMSDDYRTTACVPGGSLDEHLPEAPWALPSP